MERDSALVLKRCQYYVKHENRYKRLWCFHVYSDSSIITLRYLMWSFFLIRWHDLSMLCNFISIFSRSFSRRFNYLIISFAKIYRKFVNIAPFLNFLLFRIIRITDVKRTVSSANILKIKFFEQFGKSLI